MVWDHTFAVTVSSHLQRSFCNSVWQEQDINQGNKAPEIARGQIFKPILVGPNLFSP